MRKIIIALLPLLFMSYSKDSLSDANPQIKTETPNLTGFLWEDLDVNGLQDIMEPGIIGVDIAIVNAQSMELINTITTDSLGMFNASIEKDLDYYLEIVLEENPIKYSMSPIVDLDIETIDNDLSEINGDWTTDIFSSNSTNDIDMGMYITSSVTGLVWLENETSADKVYSGAIDQLLSHQTVKLFTINSSDWEETLVEVTQTDINGEYKFDFIKSERDVYYFLEFEIDRDDKMKFLSADVGNSERRDSDVIEILATGQELITGRTSYFSTGPNSQIVGMNAGVSKF